MTVDNFPPKAFDEPQSGQQTDFRFHVKKPRIVLPIKVTAGKAMKWDTAPSPLVGDVFFSLRGGCTVLMQTRAGGMSCAVPISDGPVKQLHSGTPGGEAL